MIAQKITLTPVTPGAPTYIQATRGENNARALRFTIIGADNKPIDLTGCTVVFYVDRTKEEKGVVQVGAVVNEDNTATVTLPSGTCAASGEWGCWVQVIKPNVYDLRADNLILRVQPCGIDEEGEASSEFTLLTQLIVEAEEAISNLDASIPYNPNQLDNWYMGRPVNQRGQGSYTAPGYSIDRYYLGRNGSGNSGTYNVGSRELSCSVKDQDGYYAYLDQRLENPSLYAGKTLTLSTLASTAEENWMIQVWRQKDSGVTEVAHVEYSGDLFKTLTFTVPEDMTDNDLLQIIVAQTRGSVTLVASKLELGGTQTLAHEENGIWVLNEMPNYTEQLLRCQRYQMKTGNASRWVRAARITSDAIFFFLPLPTQMASNPAIVDSSALMVKNMSGQEQTGFTFSATAQNDVIRIQATKTGHGLSDANLELINALFDANL